MNLQRVRDAGTVMGFIFLITLVTQQTSLDTQNITQLGEKKRVKLILLDLRYNLDTEGEEDMLGKYL